MRNSRGFSEQLDRMRRRPLRSAFFEMLAAKQFLKRDYEIAARPETRKRGDDFDFAAIKDDQTINVEVTALEAPQYSENTIVNRLSDKRTQVPETAPAIMFCVIPTSWLQTRDVDWDEVLSRITTRFFRGTKRWNAIVFWFEEQRRATDGRTASYLIRKPYSNSDTYHPLDIGFFFDGIRTEDGRAALQTKTGTDELEKVAYNSEFYRWIDSLVYQERVQWWTKIKNVFKKFCGVLLKALPRRKKKY